MRRTPIRRDGPGARAFAAQRSEIKRTKPIRKVNPERKAERHAVYFGEDGAYVAWLHTLPCDCGCGRWERDRMHAHHSLSRGAGGTARHLVVLHWSCHERGHAQGWQTFQRERGCDLEWAAADHYLRWLAWTRDKQTMGLRSA